MPARRAVLRGLGVSIGLPWLETLSPRPARAGDPAPAGLERPAASPLRLACLYVPNGVHLADWTPATEGALHAASLPPTLQPLHRVADRLLVLSGLALDAGSSGEGGHHAGALAGFLTGERPARSEGADLRAGISADQVVAERRGHLTRLPSLELGVDPPAPSSRCDPGYAGAYSSHLSWKTPTQPAASETDPALVFDRLFGTGPPDPRRDRIRWSVLDCARRDLESLTPRLGEVDRAKLDQYLTAVRDVERRLSRSTGFRPARAPLSGRPAWRPTGDPADHQTQLRLMCDLMVIAFQADITRVATFLMANEASQRSYPALDVHDSHVDLAHQAPSPEQQRKLARIDRFHVTQLAYFLEKLRSIREPGGTLLDNTLVVYGSGLSDAARHSHDDLPILLAGGRGGSLRPGRHIRHAPGTPLSNLHLSLLRRMNTPVESLGDSTEALADL